MTPIPQFYKSESDFQKIHHQLKQSICPHCNQIGTLNLHGYLKGFTEIKGNDQIIRGHRIYCSNRGNRNGCGKTFSITLHTRFKKYIITTDILWQYLKQMAKGLNIFQALHSIESIFKTSTVYRLIRMIILNQPTIRTLLLNKHFPPKQTKTSNPLLETIHHLQSSFSNHSDPISAFQIHFQTPFI